MIKAEIVAHSLSPQRDELISVLCTFPRIILAEVNTHRMLSKNTSSSRAIPFKKMVEAIENDPFIPIAWQKEHKGMQGSEYITKEVFIKEANANWLQARDYAVKQAEYLSQTCQVTKQLCNRLLEPFMWTTMLITGSKEGWDNFFNLRCPQYQTPVSQTIEPQYSWKDLIENHSNPINLKLLEDNKDNILFKLQHNKGQAEIHMMALAECIYDAVNESTPKQLESNQWHIPFEDKLDEDKIEDFLRGPYRASYIRKDGDITQAKIEISTAMAARTSYTVVGNEKDIDYSKMIELHDRLLSQNPPHSSPLEHCGRAMTDDEYYLFNRGQASIDTWSKSPSELYFSTDSRGWCNNLKGFIPYRYFIDNNLEI